VRVVLACIAAALVALHAHADPADDLARLKQEAARLRQSLDELDARIRTLEGGNPGPAAPGTATDVSAKPPAPSYFQLQRNWSEIEPGASKDRVNTLLGKPEREMHINGDLVWYYVYPGLGRGSVFFSTAGKVAAVQPPRVGWSW
jgi:SmpA / OmlA family